LEYNNQNPQSYELNMKPVFFDSPGGFRKWLATNHKKKYEILIQFYKKGSGKASLQIAEAVEQALCFGWIDGKLRNTGPKTFALRFTPRRKGSLWSEVNIRRANELIKQG